MVLEASIRNALASTFGEDTARFNDYKIAAELDKGERVISLGPVFGRGQRVDYDALEAHNAKQYVGEGKERSIKVLKGVILELKRDLEARQARLGAQFITAQPEPLPSNKVFIVHGHDETALQGVARFIERLRLEAIILREQPNQGRTTIEKFEDYAREVGFAVVLLTPDDVVSSKTVPEQCERARQNVIFELGYFAGKLGRGRACLIRKGHVEIPSDLMGVVYLDLDEKEGWKLALVKELKAAKLQFSADRAFD
jgi:predicted nucleotide-binding protein